MSEEPAAPSSPETPSAKGARSPWGFVALALVGLVIGLVVWRQRRAEREVQLHALDAYAELVACLVGGAEHGDLGEHELGERLALRQASDPAALRACLATEPPGPTGGDDPSGDAGAAGRADGRADARVGTPSTLATLDAALAALAGERAAELREASAALAEIDLAPVAVPPPAPRRPGQPPSDELLPGPEVGRARLRGLCGRLRQLHGGLAALAAEQDVSATALGDAPACELELASLGPVAIADADWEQSFVPRLIFPPLHGEPEVRGGVRRGELGVGAMVPVRTIPVSTLRARPAGEGWQTVPTGTERLGLWSWTSAGAYGLVLRRPVAQAPAGTPPTTIPGWSAWEFDGEPADPASEDPQLVGWHERATFSPGLAPQAAELVDGRLVVIATRALAERTELVRLEVDGSSTGSESVLLEDLPGATGCRIRLDTEGAVSLTCVRTGAGRRGHVRVRRIDPTGALGEERDFELPRASGRAIAGCESGDRRWLVVGGSVFASGDAGRSWDALEVIERPRGSRLRCAGETLALVGERAEGLEAIVCAPTGCVSHPIPAPTRAWSWGLDTEGRVGVLVGPAHLPGTRLLFRQPSVEAPLVAERLYWAAPVATRSVDVFELEGTYYTRTPDES